MIKRPLVCIFGHPDDEALGPGGSIAKFATEREVYIIWVTNGQAGKDSSAAKRLALKRHLEVKRSAQILGVKEEYFFRKSK